MSRIKYALGVSLLMGAGAAPVFGTTLEVSTQKAASRPMAPADEAIELASGARLGAVEDEGGGGEIPTPFDTPNQKAELADGEKYLLLGQIVQGPCAPSQAEGSQQVCFEPDFKRHPWLANQRRLSHPLYAIENVSWDAWKKYAGVEIRFAFRAKGTLFTDAQGKTKYVIVLEPISCARPDPAGDLPAG